MHVYTRIHAYLYQYAIVITVACFSLLTYLTVIVHKRDGLNR